jgi:endonuclease YncB( thermonuclease family)
MGGSIAASGPARQPASRAIKGGMLGRSLVAVLAAAAWASAAATELPSGVAVRERAEVRTVLDGRTFVLADGRTVRLAGIDVPRPGMPGERAGRRQAVAVAAQDALSELLAGGAIGLAPLGGGTDRYGRILAHAVDARGRWVQAEMVAGGFARVTMFPGESVGLRPLLALEAEAREARRGLWALPEFRVIGADEALRHLDSFQLVEGRVRNVERRAGRTFVNFGEDWRSDFTVEIAARLRRQLASAGLDPADYQGKIVRVRGWIKSRNGPLIELAQPEQIEVIAQ